jgi:hypothetical protein
MNTYKGIQALLSLGLTAIAFSGCVSQLAADPKTVSGKPEVVIVSRDIDAMKSNLTESLLKYGYQKDKDTPDTLSLWRTTTDPITAHAVGNTDSMHQRVVTYTFSKQGQSTRIIAEISMRAQLPGGQVDTVSLNDSGTLYGLLQQQLDKLKETLESGKSTP